MSPEEQAAPAFDEEKAVVLLELAKAEARSLGAFKLHGMRKGMKPELVEVLVEGLVRQKRLEPFKHWKQGRCYRVPGAVTDATAQRHSVADDGPRLKRVEKKEPTMAAEYVPTEEAAKILGVTVKRAMHLARTGEVKARKVADYAGKGHPPWEFLRSSLIAKEPNFLAEEQPDPPQKPKRGKVVQLVPREKKTRVAATRPTAAPTAAPASDLSAHVRWVVEGYKLGRFSADQALEQIVELVG